MEDVRSGDFLIPIPASLGRRDWGDGNRKSAQGFASGQALSFLRDAIDGEFTAGSRGFHGAGGRMGAST